MGYIIDGALLLAVGVLVGILIGMGIGLHVRVPDWNWHSGPGEDV